MIDIRIIREYPDIVKKALADRGNVLDIQPAIAADQKRRGFLVEIEQAQAKRNKNSAAIGMLKGREKKAEAAGDSASLAELASEAETLSAEVRSLNQLIEAHEQELAQVDAALQDILYAIPNIPHGSCPVGSDETFNEEIRRWGEPPHFSFKHKAHYEIGEDLGILDQERGAKIAKARFTLYIDKAALLERALINFMLDLHTTKHGYIEIMPPVLVKSASLYGTGQLPKFSEEIFRCCDDDLWLIPTSEVPLTNIHRDEILAGDELPKYYTAFTPCFRREAGAAGKETRGLIRQHQFNKVELVKIVDPTTSYMELESLTEAAEKVLQELGLAYRVVALATGDLGFSSAKTYDIEVWMPSYNNYKEISSCSNCTDFQARRASIRYRTHAKDKPQFVHTLNGSGIAVGRCVAAILENFQRDDGSVVIPSVLHRYTNGVTEIR